MLAMGKTEDSRFDVSTRHGRQRVILWLAAMLECEGTFTFQYNEQVKNGVLHSHIQPRIIFVNSDFTLIDAVSDAFRVLGFIPYEGKPKCTGVGKKPKRDVQFNGFKCLPLLKMLREEMVGAKCEVVDCMVAFIEYRTGLKQPKQKYGDYEFELLRRVREINSGSWNNKPKFSSISTTSVGDRRDAAKLVLVAKQGS